MFCFIVIVPYIGSCNLRHMTMSLI
jgi:hypothetical protein